MHATSEGQPWDFSHVLSLVNSLSYNNGAACSDGEGGDTKRRDSPQSGNDEVGGAGKNGNIATKDFAVSSNGLGDFSKIYQYLGTPLSSPAPAVQPYYTNSNRSTYHVPSKDDYASDGATYVKSSLAGNKNVSWNDSISADEPTTGDASDTSVIPSSPTLTKSQRKKRNRKERKAKEAADAAKAATVSESEAEISLRKKTPASKASAHVRAETPTKRYNLRPRTGQSSNGTGVDLSASVQTAVERLEAAKRANAEASKIVESDATPSKPPRPNPSLARRTSHPPTVPPSLPPNPQVAVEAPTQPASTTKWPVTPAQKEQVPRFLPATVPPPKNAAQPSGTPSPIKALQQTAPSKYPRMIEPMIVRSGEDRHWALLMKLLGDFWTDRSYLINPMNLTTHNNDPRGIHVFVDASNIFIGFNDQLKRSRGIPPFVQVPAVDLSFDALALLMERRRPVAKRVLAGSNPWLAAFDKAKAVGYECSILEKVYKARELTERQIFFREQDRLMGRGRGAKAPPANAVAMVNGGGASSGNGSGSETNAPQYARPAMIEQGVDEILHLKILESIVDTEEPATIVLATGDAAQAEYSQGFMAMAERALKKGWTVELVSWSKNISAMYTRKAWTDAWGERFKVIFLDDYAEELLAM